MDLQTHWWVNWGEQTALKYTIFNAPGRSHTKNVFTSHHVATNKLWLIQLLYGTSDTKPSTAILNQLLQLLHLWTAYKILRAV